MVRNSAVFVVLVYTRIKTRSTFLQPAGKDVTMFYLHHVITKALWAPMMQAQSSREARCFDEMDCH